MSEFTAQEKARQFIHGAVYYSPADLDVDEALVDALAAAIEHDDAERELAIVHEATDVESIQRAEFRLARAEKERRRALSALREGRTYA